jgi:hypothetical protein
MTSLIAPWLIAAQDGAYFGTAGDLHLSGGCP